MSSTTEVNRVRERVLKLAREIEKLSKSDVPPEEFFSQFLQMLVGALGAQAGAVWTMGEGNRLNVAAEVGLAETGILEDPQAGFRNQKLLSEVMQTGEAGSFAPGDGGDVELPTEHLIVLAALQVESDSVGVVQIFQRPDAPAEARPGFLQFVEQMSGYASLFLSRRKQAGERITPEKFWLDFEQFVLQLQRSLDVEEVASTAASDARLLLGCDRVSVVMKRGKKIAVKAISGQDAVNPRANLVRAMVRVCTKVMKLREPVTYAGRVENLSPQIEVPLADYIQESSSRMVMLIPLTATDPLVIPDEDADDRKKKAKKAEVIGCLVVEQVANSELAPELTERSELIADHAAAALTNARAHQRVLFLRTWKFFGRTLEWFHGRKLAKTVAVLSIIAAVVLSLLLVPWDYRVEGKGRLMPVVQQVVFCPVDGEIEKIYVVSGEQVTKGQKLFLLRNLELSEQLIAVKNRLNESRSSLIALAAQRDEARNMADNSKSTELEGKIEETREQARGLLRQVAMLQKRVEKLTIRAPIPGTVATFQIRKLLLNRPVRRGEKLIEIMDDRGKWHLELEVEEQRMGHLLRAQRELKKEILDVEFILATAPESTFDGKLVRISSRANTSGEEGNVVEVFVDPDDVSKLPNRRIGADVRAKINCGKRSLGYVLFGDVVEFVQKYLWL